MVLVAQRWILARLRNRTFFDLAELNAAIRELLDELNGRLMQKLEGQPAGAVGAARSAGAQAAACRPLRAGAVEAVPGEHRLPRRGRPPPLQRPVPARRRAAGGALHQHGRRDLLQGRRLESHPRRYDRGATTRAEHMPSSHRAHAEWTPSRLIHWAEKTGPATGRLVAGILESRPHPEQGYRACLGLMRLGKTYGAERLEAACERAEHLRSYSYRTVKNILASAQDRLPFEDQPEGAATPVHDNIRGGAYYAHDKEHEC